LSFSFSFFCLVNGQSLRSFFTHSFHPHLPLRTPPFLLSLKGPQFLFAPLASHFSSFPVFLCFFARHPLSHPIQTVSFFSPLFPVFTENRCLFWLIFCVGYLSTFKPPSRMYLPFPKSWGGNRFRHVSSCCIISGRVLFTSVFFLLPFRSEVPQLAYCVSSSSVSFLERSLS